MSSLICCRVCGQVQHPAREAPAPDQAQHCCRCGARFMAPGPDPLQRTAALALAALILYLPANTYPILEMEWYGAHRENTIWEGSEQ